MTEVVHRTLGDFSDELTRLLADNVLKVVLDDNGGTFAAMRWELFERMAKFGGYEVYIYKVVPRVGPS